MNLSVYQEVRWIKVGGRLSASGYGKKGDGIKKRGAEINILKGGHTESKSGCLKKGGLEPPYEL